MVDRRGSCVPDLFSPLREVEESISNTLSSGLRTNHRFDLDFHHDQILEDAAMIEFKKSKSSSSFDVRVSATFKEEAYAEVPFTLAMGQKESWESDARAYLMGELARKINGNIALSLQEIATDFEKIRPNDFAEYKQLKKISESIETLLRYIDSGTSLMNAEELLNGG